jgi:uncharacterized membrane protein
MVTTIDLRLTQMAIVLLTTLAAGLSLPYFRKFNELFPTTHPAFIALLSGILVSVLTYAPMRLADRKFAFSNAILLGLLVAEFVVYGAPFNFPAPVALSFFFFMFFYGREEATLLWPQTYEGEL